MPSRVLRPMRRALEDRELRRLLNQTEDALVLSEARLRKSCDGLSEARQQNAQYRRTLSELRRALSIL